MDKSYHFCQLILFMVLVWTLNGRTAWSITRRGEFVGCFANISHTPCVRALLSDASRSVDECISACIRLKADFVTLGDEGTTTYCSCFNFTGNENEVGTVVPLSRCNTSCPGNQTESCGGYNVFAVYRTMNRTCDDPGTPIDGSRMGDDFIFGSDVVYNCSTGLVADGPTVAQCWWVDNITLEISWSSPAPDCVDPSSLVTTEASKETNTIPPRMVTMVTSTIRLSTINMGIIMGIFFIIFLIIIIVVSVMVFMWKKRQKRRADFSRNSIPSSLPLSSSKAQLTQTTPKKEEKHENEVEDEDYLVPDPNVVASAKKGSGQGKTLERVENRPRLPAPPSVKASLTPAESLYQNSISIALSRSKENLHKETKENPCNEPSYQNRTVVTRQDRARATEGAVGKPPTARTSSLPLDADGIYQNAQIGVRMSSPRMPLTARLSEERRASHDSSGPASQRSSLNFRDSVDYVTPNETTEQEVYENAGLVRKRQGPRRPPGQPVEKAAAVDTGDSDGVYLDLI